MRQLVSVALVSILCFGLCKPHCAAGASLHVTPSLIIEQEYSGNYYRNEGDKVGVWTIRAAPGIGVQAAGGRSELNFSYHAPYSWHIDTDEDADVSEDDYLGHDLSFSAVTRLFTRMTLGVRNDYFLTREPTSSDEFSHWAERSKYWRNRFEPFYIYELGHKGEIRLGYRYEVLDYRDARAGEEDSYEDRGILTLTYHLNSSNHLDLENQLWSRRYKGVNSDYDAYQAKLIFRHEFNSFLSGRAGVGYQHRDFDEEPLSDEKGFVFDAGLSGVTDRSKLNLALQYNLADFTQGNDYFKAVRGDVYFERILRRALRPYVGGYYQFSDYINREREDRTWNGYIGIAYLFFKRFEIGLEYNHLRNDSTERGRDYAENRLFVRFLAKHDFDLGETFMRHVRE